MQTTGKKKQMLQYLYQTKKLQKKKVARDKEGHYIVIKGSVQQEDITIINIYSPNEGEPTYVKQILTELQGEIE